MRRRRRPSFLLAVLVLAGCRSSDVGDEQLSQYPTSPYEDRSGALWFQTAFDGLLRYRDGRFTRFTTTDGLPSDTLRGVHEDDDGTLWFATGGGLCRFDGARFEPFVDYAAPSTGAGFGGFGHHRDVWDVTRDSRGRLWICTLDGVFRLEGRQLVRFPLDALAEVHEYEFTPNMVYGVYEDHDGALWFATDGAGAVRWDGERQVALTTADGLCSDHVACVVRDGRSVLWFGTSNGGVSRYDGERFETLFRNPEWSEHNGWGRFLNIVVDRRGDVWTGRSSPGGGVWRYDGRSYELLGEERGLGDGGVISVGEDRRGTIWVGTTAGVFRFDGERFAHFGWRAGE